MEFRQNTFYGLLFEQSNLLVDAVMIAFSVAFMAILSNIYIPLWPVPVTMQTFGVFCIAFFFGARKGIIALAAYVLAGILGLGVFSGYKSGFQAIAGPTGGYILGFMAMAFFVGIMIEKGFGRTKRSVLALMILGQAILYFFGLAGLYIYFGNIGLIKILSMGLFPFLIGDAMKAIAAVMLFPLFWNAIEKTKS